VNEKFQEFTLACMLRYEKGSPIGEPFLLGDFLDGLDFLDILDILDFLDFLDFLDYSTPKYPCSRS
jgi:hypothetical protein